MKIDLKELIPEFSNNLKLDYDLKKKNWFNIGGKTKAFYKADNLKELIKFLKKIQNHERIFVLGAEPGVLSVNPTGHKRYMYFLDGNVFLISEPIDDQEATIGNGSTIGFAIKSPEQGEEWHDAGINNGGTTCEGPPGIREGMGMKLYLAYLRDPSGNKLCGLLNL